MLHHTTLQRGDPGLANQFESPTQRVLLQDEVLGNVKDTEWSVLIMDTTTTPVMSSVCRISEILDYGVSRKAPTANLLLSIPCPPSP